MKRISFAWMLLLIASACSNSNKGQQEEQAASQDQLFDEVMEIHDEVMPRFRDISSMNKKIKQKMESTSDSTTYNSLKEASATLEAANQSMRGWMSNIKRPDEIENLEEEKARAYLEEEKKKIAVVRQKMLEAIELGEKVLAQE